MIVQELATGEKLAAFAVGGQEAAAEEAVPFSGETYAKELPGVTDPLGFFDPAGFCSADGITEGKIKFYREVELKHGRVGMLAALGFLVGENFHPLFGGDIDVLAIAIPEIYSVFSFETPALFSGALGAKAGNPW